MTSCECNPLEILRRMGDNESSNEDSLLDEVRNAALEFCGMLERAKQATSDWQDELQTNEFVASALNQCLKRLDSSGIVGEASRLPSSEL